MDTAINARLTTTTLASGNGFEVVQTRWRRGEHPARTDAAVSYAAFEFMLSGCYRKRSGPQRVVGDANTVVYFQPGERFTIEHPFGDENCGVTIRLEPGRFDEALEDARSSELQRRTQAFEDTHAVTSTALHLRLQRLVRQFQSDASQEPMEVAERVMGIVRTSLNSGVAHRPLRTRADRHVEAALEYLDQHFAQKVTLRDLAQAAGVSSCRISRVFSVCVGVPVHRYLTQLRLREALTRMTKGVTDLTCLALEVGFSSHSHFTAAFHGEFGRTPRDMRAT